RSLKWSWAITTTRGAGAVSLTCAGDANGTRLRAGGTSLAVVEAVAHRVQDRDRLLELECIMRTDGCARFGDVEPIVPHVPGGPQPVAIGLPHVELPAGDSRIVAV